MKWGRGGQIDSLPHPEKKLPSKSQPLLCLNHRKKVMTQAFSCYKLTRKLCLLYLEVKLQQNRSG